MAFDHQLESDRNCNSTGILLRIPLLLLGIILNYSIIKEIGGSGGSTTTTLERKFHTIIDQQLIRTNKNNRIQSQQQSVVGRKWSPSLQTIDEAVEEETEREEEEENTTTTTIGEAVTTQESSSSFHVSSLFLSCYLLRRENLLKTGLVILNLYLSVSSISPRIMSSVLRRYSFFWFEMWCLWR